MDEEDFSGPLTIIYIGVVRLWIRGRFIERPLQFRFEYISAISSGPINLSFKVIDQWRLDPYPGKMPYKTMYDAGMRSTLMDGTKTNGLFLKMRDGKVEILE